MRRPDVQIGPRFYGDVRDAFPSERGPNGEPSADDFTNIALPALVDAIAEQFDRLPLEPTTPGVRMLIAPTVFGAVVIYATDTPDDVVHLLAIEFDL